MQMSNGSPGWEESHLCQAASTLRLAHSPPGSSPHKLTCLMPPHQDWVHILGAGGCALPEDPRDFSEVHRTPPREGRWSPVTKYIGFSITAGPILTQPLACHGALRKSLHPFSLKLPHLWWGDQQHLPWRAVRAVKSDNECGVLSTVPGTQ